MIGTEATLEVRAANSYRFMIMTSPVGSYFNNLQKGVSLRVEDRIYPRRQCRWAGSGQDSR